LVLQYRFLITQNHAARRIAGLQPALCLAVLAFPALALAQEVTPPAAATGPSPATGLSGYMDFHFNKRQFEDARLDFHRFVLLVTHRFSDRLRFVGELELEHALVEGLEAAGELELEQAYLDFALTRAVSIRAGMLLVPVGIINERHEPPVFYGVERPFVDTAIVPTTWFEPGAGVHGEVGAGWRYRAYVMAPLNAAEFNAEEGIRGGRQKGSDANARGVAVTGRLEYVGYRGLTLGASVWTGRSGFEFRPVFDVPVRVIEADVRFSRDRLEVRGQFAQVAIENAAQLNDRLTQRIGVNPNIASTLRGSYAEVGYRVVSGAAFGEVGIFARYENVDTQAEMPGGYVPLKEFDRDAWVLGASYWPDPDIAVKVDYVIMRSQSPFAAPNSFNVGLGWWF
jgi:hypothetical protein